MKKQPELIIEEHPESYTGLPFLTLIKFQNTHLLCVVDNINVKTLKAYVLDYCGPEQVDEQLILSWCSKWWESADNRQMPISIFFSKNGIASETSKIYKELDVNNIVRLIGPVQYFEMKEIENVRKRKRSKHRNTHHTGNRSLRLVVDNTGFVDGKFI